MPERPQQVLTIGLIQMLVNAAFTKLGKLFDEVEYRIMTAASAFDSHSRAKLEKAFAKREAIPT